MLIFTHPIYIKGDNGDDYFVFRSARLHFWQTGQILSKFEQICAKFERIAQIYAMEWTQNSSKMLRVTIVTDTDDYSTVSRTLLVVLNVISTCRYTVRVDLESGYRISHLNFL